MSDPQADADDRAAPAAGASPQPSTTDAPDRTTVPAGTGPDDSTGPGDGTALGVQLTVVAELASPIAMSAHPVTGDLFVAERGGDVWRLGEDGTPPVQVLSLRGQVSTGCENGLLGMAFTPDGESLVVSYTDTERHSRVAVYPAADPRQAIDPDARRVLLGVDQPACNHNGGHIAFGPDAMAWLGFGDGGGADDVFGHGQDATTLLGTLARIDVSPPGGVGYAVPEDNPWAGRRDAPEVWAYGLRNPWRFSFDRVTGDLWIGDVGQNAWEEIHVLPAADGYRPGANLGWPVYEGIEPFTRDGGASSRDTAAGFDFPSFVYGHDEGCSVTGGYVYRGRALPHLQGVYVFGDYCAGELWGLTADADGAARRHSLGLSVPRNTLVSFGEDAAGEMYVLSSAGAVYRLDPVTR